MFFEEGVSPMLICFRVFKLKKPGINAHEKIIELFDFSVCKFAQQNK